MKVLALRLLVPPITVSAYMVQYPSDHPIRPIIVSAFGVQWKSSLAGLFFDGPNSGIEGVFGELVRGVGRCGFLMFAAEGRSITKLIVVDADGFVLEG